MRKAILILALSAASVCVISAQTKDDYLSKSRYFVSKDSVSAAVSNFEKVLELDPANYEALTYLSNYSFLTGKLKSDSIDAVYARIQTPTRMQQAHRQEQLRKVYDQWIFRSEQLLIKAFSIRRNVYMDDLAGKIASFKERIGLPNAGK